MTLLHILKRALILIIFYNAIFENKSKIFWKSIINLFINTLSKCEHDKMTICQDFFKIRFGSQVHICADLLDQMIRLEIQYFRSTHVGHATTQYHIQSITENIRAFLPNSYSTSIIRGSLTLQVQEYFKFTEVFSGSPFVRWHKDVHCKYKKQKKR